MMSFQDLFRELRRRSLAAPSRVPAEAAGLTAIPVTRFPGFATPPRGGSAFVWPVLLVDREIFVTAGRSLEPRYGRR
jgi:hypothetical protein